MLGGWFGGALRVHVFLAVWADPDGLFGSQTQVLPRARVIVILAIHIRCSTLSKYLEL